MKRLNLRRHHPVNRQLLDRTLAVIQVSILHFPQITNLMPKFSAHCRHTYGMGVQCSAEWHVQTNRPFACILLPWERRPFWFTVSIDFHCAPNWPPCGKAYRACMAVAVPHLWGT